MPKLIGVTGYSGAGKTSAIEYIAIRSGADRIYVGQLVADEVVARELPPGPESERAVRVKLREDYGMAGLAVLAAPQVAQSLSLGKSVVIDAICSLEEFEYYREKFDKNGVLVSVLASFEVRAERIAAREEKSMTRAELLKRDVLENTILRMDLAIEAATIQIDNEYSLAALRKLLDAHVCGLIQ